MKTSWLAAVSLIAAQSFATDYQVGAGYSVRGVGMDETSKYFPRGYGVELKASSLFSLPLTASTSYSFLQTQLKTNEYYDATIHQGSVSVAYLLGQARTNTIHLKLSADAELHSATVPNTSAEFHYTGAGALNIVTQVSDRLETVFEVGYRASTLPYYQQDLYLEAKWQIQLIGPSTIQPYVQSNIDFNNFQAGALLAFKL